ncbi:hypothetical protein ACSBOB_00870 [Mesorhizobium sp. ASY16-5R]|uniref:hypothetical protein n=1 Tax=Mesorhizobium sp. ASY16-5R TaxID=3445772 RepID=UPI003F9F327C
MSDENNRETGVRKPQPGVSHRPDPIHSGDRGNEPKEPYGLTESVDDVDEKTRHADGQQPSRQPTPSPATEKLSGAGPAIAEHSKDAKAPKAGRQPGAYVKK